MNRRVNDRTQGQGVDIDSCLTATDHVSAICRVVS